VSGVVFSLNDASVHREVAGHRLFFCCDGCAGYFDADQARIIAARRLSFD
jgi:hypothetical protein